MAKYITADPYPYPYDGDLRPDNTCLIVIDMQTDFCGIGGYVDKMGYDLSLTRAPIAPIAAVLAACCEQGYSVMHTREGHRPDLADLPANKRWRSRRIGAGIRRSAREATRLEHATRQLAKPSLGASKPLEKRHVRHRREALNLRARHSLLERKAGRNVQQQKLQ